jgi:hypothetical protein
MSHAGPLQSTKWNRTSQQNARAKCGTHSRAGPARFTRPKTRQPSGSSPRQFALVFPSDRTRPTLTSARPDGSDHGRAWLSNDHHTMLAASANPRAYIDACNAHRTLHPRNGNADLTAKEKLQRKNPAAKKTFETLRSTQRASRPQKVKLIIGHRARPSASQPSAYRQNLKARPPGKFGVLARLWRAPERSVLLVREHRSAAKTKPKPEIGGRRHRMR